MRLGIWKQRPTVPTNVVLIGSQVPPASYENLPLMIIVKFFSKYRNCLFRTADSSLSCFILFSGLNLKPRGGYLNDIILNCVNTYHFTDIQITDLSTISDSFIGNN